MRFGLWQVTRLRRDKLGRPLHPWELVTLDQLSEEARLLIQKMARVCARDFFEEQREGWREELRAELLREIEHETQQRAAREERAAAAAAAGRYMDGRGPAEFVGSVVSGLPPHKVVFAPRRADKAKAAAELMPEGECLVCEQPLRPGQVWKFLATREGWMHIGEPDCIVVPIKKLDPPRERPE